MSLLRNPYVIIGALAVVLVAAVVAVVWVYSPHPVPTTPTQSVADGFKPFASFRDSDPPGAVFRVSSNGEIRKVTLLPVKTFEADEVTYGIHAKRSFSISQLLKVVGVDCGSEGQSFDPSAEGTVDVSSVEGTREYTYDDDLDAQLKLLRERFANHEIEYRPSDRYWVIREAIKTPQVDYESTKNWIVAAKADAALRDCVQSLESVDGSASLDLGSAEKVTLKRQFPKPLRGWY